MDSPTSQQVLSPTLGPLSSSTSLVVDDNITVKACKKDSISQSGYDAMHRTSKLENPCSSSNASATAAPLSGNEPDVVQLSLPDISHHTREDLRWVQASTTTATATAWTFSIDPTMLLRDSEINSSHLALPNNDLGH